MTDRERIRDYVHANPGVDEYDISDTLELPLFDVVEHCKYLVQHDVIQEDGKPCRHTRLFRREPCPICEGAS